MGALLGDAAGDQDGDLVGVAGGGDAVGDEEGGASAHDLAQTGEDDLFGVGVDAGQGVVEDEDAGVAQDGAGDGLTEVVVSGPTQVAAAELAWSDYGPDEDEDASWRSAFGSAAPILFTLAVVAVVAAVGGWIWLQNRPQHDAGMRIDPPPSLAWAAGTIPPATAADAPPEEPPGVRVRS